jgi:hypothetical protein
MPIPQILSDILSADFMELGTCFEFIGFPGAMKEAQTAI